MRKKLLYAIYSKAGFEFAWVLTLYQSHNLAIYSMIQMIFYLWMSCKIYRQFICKIKSIKNQSIKSIKNQSSSLKLIFALFTILILANLLSLFLTLNSTNSTDKVIILSLIQFHSFPLVTLIHILLYHIQITQHLPVVVPLFLCVLPSFYYLIPIPQMHTQNYVLDLPVHLLQVAVQLNHCALNQCWQLHRKWWV